MDKESRSFLFLKDIHLSMERISEYTSGFDLKKFKRDYKTVDAVIRNFEIIGEAAKNLPDRIKTKYPQVPWQEMYYLRNKVFHEYHGIDNKVIWDIATNYLPDNKIQIETIIST